MTRDHRFAGETCWNYLPFFGLTDTQRDNLQLEIYHQLILLSLLRMRNVIMKITAGKDLSNRQTLIDTLMNPHPDAATGFRSALEPLKQAIAMEEKKLAPSTMTRFLLTWECERLLLFSGKFHGLKLLLLILEKPPEVGDQNKLMPHLLRTWTDCFCLGSTYFFVGMHPRDPLSEMMQREWQTLNFNSSLQKAEDLLRGSAKFSTRQFWPHFLLGWLQFHNKNYMAAELALDRCIELRPKYSLAYELRGQAILGHALEAPGRRGPGPPTRDVRLGRALDDFRMARNLGATTRLLTGQRGICFSCWSAGNALDELTECAEALGRTPDCLDAYAQAMDLEDDVLEYPFRRNKLEETRSIAEQKAQKDPGNADFQAILAQAFLLLKRHNESFVAANRALVIRADHDRALTVRGAVYFSQGQFDQALDDFNKALKMAARNYLAASGRAGHWRNSGGMKRPGSPSITCCRVRGPARLGLP